MAQTADYWKEYAKKNKDKKQKYYKEYKEKNKDKIKEYSKKWRDSHKEYIKDYVKSNGGGYAMQRKNREKIFELYGKSCVCCGETHKEFLTLEHKKGQKGNLRETQYQAYKNAASRYQPEKYEILCMNCNFAKGKVGYCPHNKK